MKAYLCLALCVALAGCGQSSNTQQKNCTYTDTGRTYQTWRRGDRPWYGKDTHYETVVVCTHVVWAVK